MASPRQITANRANAARSSGPKTPDGRARSSRNAERHGLFGKAEELNEDVILTLAQQILSAPQAPLADGNPIHACAIRLAVVETRLTRIRAHLASIDARLTALIENGDLVLCSEARGEAELHEQMGIARNPDPTARAAALAKLEVVGKLEWLDPVALVLRERRLALRHRGEAEAERSKALREWEKLSWTPRTGRETGQITETKPI